MSVHASYKPRQVLSAEWALWIWTVWACLYGLYDNWAHPTDIKKILADQMQADQMGLIISSETLHQLDLLNTWGSLGFYLVAALSSVWIILEMGKGKSWARTTVMLGFILDTLWSAGQIVWGLTQTDLGGLECFSDAIDFILESYAVYMIYSEPGKSWFETSKQPVRS